MPRPHLGANRRLILLVFGLGVLTCLSLCLIAAKRPAHRDHFPHQRDDVRGQPRRQRHVGQRANSQHGQRAGIRARRLDQQVGRERKVVTGRDRFGRAITRLPLGKPARVFDQRQRRSTPQWDAQGLSIG